MSCCVEIVTVVLSVHQPLPRLLFELILQLTAYISLVILRLSNSSCNRLTHWNARSATGCSALQDLRSCAILQASLALSPVSSSICCTHVRQGCPRWRFHSGLMSCLPPARASTARRSAEWVGVVSGTKNGESPPTNPDC